MASLRIILHAIGRVSLFLRRVRTRLLYSVFPTVMRPSRARRMVRLGSDYGGWLIPVNYLSKGDVCYAVGVGEDASFDIALARELGCEVHSFDPTPRAVDYMGDLEPIPGVEFHPIGVWKEDGQIQFYAPATDSHVSHSAVNIQRSEKSFFARVRTISSLMEQLGHSEIALLKLDIEGAEYEVLDQMLNTSIRPGVLLVEFDQPTPVRETLRMRNRLGAEGYELIAVEGWNSTFIATSENSG